MLYFGQASIITTFLFYILIGLGCWAISNYFLAKKSNEKHQNISLFIVSSVICLLVAEISLKYVFQANLTFSEKSGGFFYRSKYRGILWETLIRKHWFHQDDLQLFVYRPNSIRVFERPEFVFESRYNSMGLRGPEPDTSAALNNIVGLGDSFTEGFGVHEDSSWFNLFVDQISLSDTSSKYQGINGGFSGSDIFYEYVVLKKLLLKYNPDYIILDINTSDIDDVIMRGGFERFKPDGTIQYKSNPWWECFYSFSYIFRGILHSTYDIHWNLLTEEQNTIEALKAEDLICDCIVNEYKELALKNKFNLVVTFHPRINELQSKTIAFARCKEKLKQENSIIFIDMQKEFEHEIEGDKIDIVKLYYPIDLHHTALGNKVWADVLSKEFQKKNLNK